MSFILLKPTDTILGLLTGSQSVYLLDIGYYHATLNILLNKSCSGFNYWILSSLVFAYLGFKYFDKPLHRALSAPISLCCAYLLTIFANSSRIFASIIVQNQTRWILPDHQRLVHETVGIITYLSFLVLTYYLTEEFLKHRKNNAKIV
ncbi:MAG: exosortase K [Fibromonadaceae bacterium]|jgi:exosortase K|nr:exosortase K [Fibromonadaceae bacterium]